MNDDIFNNLTREIDRMDSMLVNANLAKQNMFIDLLINTKQEHLIEQVKTRGLPTTIILSEDLIEYKGVFGYYSTVQFSQYLEKTTIVLSWMKPFDLTNNVEIPIEQVSNPVFNYMQHLKYL